MKLEARKLPRENLYEANEARSFRERKGTQSTLEAARSRREGKWMKPEARKLHKAVPNNNVF